MKNERINKSEADLWSKLYTGKETNSEVEKIHNQTTNQIVGSSLSKNEVDIWNEMYQGKKPVSGYMGNVVKSKRSFIKVFKNKKIFFSMAAILILVLIGGFFIFLKNDGLTYLFQLTSNGVPYTKNPSVKSIPLGSVVKIVVEQGTDREASGSGLLFTIDGYILTNAHVITTPLGKDVKDIKVCYSTSNNQEVKCDYTAKIINADRFEDLAVIKVDREIREIKPYLIVVQEDEELRAKEVLPLGSELRAAGFPGVGGNSITLTKGIVSGYINGEITYDDGSLQKIPYFIKTDTEINHGNSGGAVFDKDNRYVGISSAIMKDDGGKLSRVIYWNKINLYLNHLIYSDVITLPSKQFIKRDYSSSENDLWAGLRAYFRSDYQNSLVLLQKYTNEHGSDSRGWNYLCRSYWELNDYEQMEKCAEKLREVSPKAQALSWYYSSYYNSDKENDNNKAYDSIIKALSVEPSSTLLLSRKADLEFELDRYEALKKTIIEILRIDEENYEAWLYTGILALKAEDYESGISYLESSFDIRPSSEIASYLSDLYDAMYQESFSTDDLYSALVYRVYSIVLDQKNIENIFSLAGTVNIIFESDTEGTWGSSLNGIAEILQGLEVDKSLIEPLGGISDVEIKANLVEMGDLESEIKQRDIDATRFFIKMTMAWLYTFLGEKNACSIEFNEIGRSNLVEILSDVSFETESMKTVIDRNVVLECLCINDDFSNEVISSCYTQKMNKVYK